MSDSPALTSCAHSEATVLTEADAKPELITSRIVAMIGYGNQASAQAKNLRDRGVHVLVGVRDPNSCSALAAKDDGFHLASISEQVGQADLVALLIPDSAQPEVFRKSVEPYLRADSAIVFGHGYNLHFGHITPQSGHDWLLVAPKAPGSEVRRSFDAGHGAPALIACSQTTGGNGLDLALAYAWGIGATRAGVLETTFAEETETDLFGEQTVLIGGVCSLMRAAWEILVESGYGQEVAYYECIQELKMVIDLVAKQGMSGMYSNISETARYGGQTRGPVLIDDHVRTEMRRILNEIQDGTFDHEWDIQQKNGKGDYFEMGEALAEHPIEPVGKRLRATARHNHPNYSTDS